MIVAAFKGISCCAFKLHIYWLEINLAPSAPSAPSASPTSSAQSQQAN
jgi:hypothetical protein